MKHLEDVLLEYEFGNNMIGMTVISTKDQNDNPINAMLQLCWLEEPPTEDKPLGKIEEYSKTILTFPTKAAVQAIIDCLEECKKHVPC
jgi:hypothetical protein